MNLILPNRKHKNLTGYISDTVGVGHSSISTYQSQRILKVVSCLYTYGRNYVVTVENQ